MPRRVRRTDRLRGRASDRRGVVRKLADARLITTEGRETSASAVFRSAKATPPLCRGPTRPSFGAGPLRPWIDTDRAGLRTHRQLTEAAREWQDHGRDESYLYVGSRLAVARKWSEAHSSELCQRERDFLEASLACVVVAKLRNSKRRLARKLGPEN